MSWKRHDKILAFHYHHTRYGLGYPTNFALPHATSDRVGRSVNIIAQGTTLSKKKEANEKKWADNVIKWEIIHRISNIATHPMHLEGATSTTDQGLILSLWVVDSQVSDHANKI